MHNKRTWILLVLGLVTLGTPSTVARGAEPPGLDTENEDAKALYRDGHEALTRGHWTKAIEHFQSLETRLRRADEPTDAAMYWRAYALDHAGRKTEARSVVRRLRNDYPQSPWNDDARRLGRTSKDPKTSELDEDVLMGLDVLLSAPPKRALPLLKKVLEGNHPPRVKARALFVLSQLDAKAADRALQRIISGPSSLDLKKEAIRMIAVGGHAASLDRLSAIYESEPALRSAVIEAWLVGSRGDLLLSAAKRAQSAPERRRAIEAMGAIRAHKALVELFETHSDPKIRHDVLQGLGIAGATDALAKIAHANEPVPIRSEAIHALGIAGARAPLAKLAKSKEPAAIRLAAIEALGLTGAVSVLFELAQSPAPSEIRTAAIQAMGIAGGKKAAPKLAQLYATQDDAVQKAVLEALLVCGGAQQLIELYRKETDRSRKRAILQMIVATNSDAALDFVEKTMTRGDQ